MSSNIPAHMRAEAYKGRAWNTAASAAGLAVLAATVCLLPLMWWVSRQPLNRYTLQAVADYFASLLPNPAIHLPYFLFGAENAPPIPAVFLSVFAALLVIGTCVFAAVRANPYRTALMLHGDARFATHADLAAMDRSGHVGPSGAYLDLGSLGRTRIAFIETLSVIVFAPPGAGKTRFLVPSILSTDNTCFIIHDPKPELWTITSGWRSRIGPTFKLEWAETDDPNQGRYYPRFNFLDPRIVPEPGGARDTFIDTLAKTLVPEGDRRDPYFEPAGRGALTGFLHYLVARINDRNDPARYEGMPQRWHNQPASLSMLVDLLAASQLTSLQAAADNTDDPMRTYMRDIVKEAIDHKYPDRCTRELQPLILMADKQRSGVIGTMETALLPLKNEAVAERTSGLSDFLPSDLGGMLRPEALERLGCEEYPRTSSQWSAIADRLKPADWAPVSVYITVNQAEAEGFATLTALFFEVMSKTLLTYGPGERTRLGAILGPYPTCFLMDEFPRLAKTDAVMDGPEYGRSKQRMYLFVAQSPDQIERRYSAQQRKTLESTTAARIILPQNDASSIRSISETVGSTTVKRSTISRHTGLSKQANPFSGNRSETHEKVSLLQTRDLAHMDPGTHLLIAQNWIHRPIRCRTTLYYEDPALSRRAWNPKAGRRQNGTPPAAPLPGWVIAKRLADHEAWRTEREALHARSRRRYWLDPSRLHQTPNLSP